MPSVAVVDERELILNQRIGMVNRANRDTNSQVAVEGIDGVDVMKIVYLAWVKPPGVVRVVLCEGHSRD